jgi:hypothetical protein
MARPPKPESSRATARFCVCLKPDTVDQIYRFAAMNGDKQAGPLVRRVLENVFGMLKTHGSSNVCYGEPRQPSASTMRYVLTSPAESGVRSGGAVSPPLDRRE